MTRIAVGDTVVAVSRGGAFAAEACVPAASCFRLPPSLPHALLLDAAGLAVAAGTADVALRRYGRLSASDVVCVTGAGGGVGTAAVQVAAGAGAMVVAVLVVMIQEVVMHLIIREEAVEVVEVQVELH